MKRKTAEAIAQYSSSLSFILFIIFIILGFILHDEGFTLFAIVMFFYFPTVLVIFRIYDNRDSVKKWMIRRKKIERQVESGLLQCPTCGKVYKREELDLSPTATPFCPDCEVKLVPYHLKREE